MTSFEVAEIKDLISSGQYEEALGISFGATRSQINRAHIKQLHRYRENDTVKECLNKAKGIITCETSIEKAQRLLRLSRWEEAYSHLKATVHESSIAQAHHLLGYTLFQLGRYKDALSSLEIAVCLRGSPSDHLWLGYAQERMGDFTNALDSYAITVKNRGDAEECRLLGNMLIKFDRFEEALAMHNRALRIDPTHNDLPKIQRQIQTEKRKRKTRAFSKKLQEICSSPVTIAIGQSAIATTISAGLYLTISGNFVGIPMFFLGLSHLFIK